MSPSVRRTANLDTMSNVAGQVTAFGESQDVLHLDGDDYQLLADGLDAVPIMALYDLAAKLVPSIAGRIRSLSAQQIGGIMAVALGVVKDVEADFPNGPGPETATPASPA